MSALLVLLALSGCWRFSCEVEADACSVTWSECDSEEGFGTATIACTPDDDRVSCTCERDGEIRGTFPQVAGTCDRLSAVPDDPKEERWAQDVARRHCSVR